MHQKRTGKQFRFHLPQQQIETLARSRVSRLSLSLSLSRNDAVIANCAAS
jgi:hypothetical protein